MPVVVIISNMGQIKDLIIQGMVQKDDTHVLLEQNSKTTTISNPNPNPNDITETGRKEEQLQENILKNTENQDQIKKVDIDRGMVSPTEDLLSHSNMNNQNKHNKHNNSMQLRQPKCCQ